MSLKKSLGVCEQSCQAYFNRENCSKRGGSFSNSYAAVSATSNLSSQQLRLPIGQTSSQTLKSTGRISMSPVMLKKQLKDISTALKLNNTQTISRNKENTDENIKPSTFFNPQFQHPQEETQLQSSSVLFSSSKTTDNKLSSKLHRQQVQIPQTKLKCHTQTDSVTLPSSTRLRKSSAASKSLSNNTLKVYSKTAKILIDSTEPQTEYALTLCRSSQMSAYPPHKELVDSSFGFPENQSQSCQLLSHKHNKNTLSSAKDIHKSPVNPGSCRYKHVDQQKQQSYDEDYEGEEVNHGSFSNETISASQVMLSTEAYSIPRSSQDQSSSEGIRLTTLNDEEPFITPFQVISCKYHAGKKGKYLAKLDNMKSCAVCSKCAIDLAQRGIIIEKAQDSVQSEMSREIQELLANLGSRRNAEEEQWQQLKLRKEQLSQFCREQVQQIEERFLSAESALISSKNKAIDQVRTMKERLEQMLEEKEEIAREWLDESARIQCEILVHYDSILNAIELNSFKAIIQNYKQKAQSAQAYFEDLSASQMSLQQLNPNQEIKQTCNLAIESLFNMDQIQQPVVVIPQNTNTEMNLNCIEGDSNQLRYAPSQQQNNNNIENNSSVCLEILHPREYHENSLPFSATQSLSLQSLNNPPNVLHTSKGTIIHQVDVFSSPDNFTKIKTNQQTRNSTSTSSQLPPRSNSSKVKINGLNDTPIVKPTGLASQISERFNQRQVENLNHCDKTIQNWKICELPQCQESEGAKQDNQSRLSFSSLKQKQDENQQQLQKQYFQHAELKENNGQFRDYQQKTSTTTAQPARPQSFRTLFVEEPRQIVQLQNQGVSKLNGSQNYNISSSFYQQMQLEQQQNQNKLFLDQLSPHTPHLQSKSFQQVMEQPQQIELQMISQETPVNRSNLNMKYQGIIDKIHANQTKNSTFYSELLKKSIKMDQQVFSRHSLVSSEVEAEDLSFKQIKDSTIIPGDGQEQQQVNSSNINKTGQFAQFIAAHFGNNHKMNSSNFHNINTNKNTRNSISQDLQCAQKNDVDNNHNISNEEIDNQQILYRNSQNNSSNGSYRKTLFQSPQFRQDCGDLEEDEEENQWKEQYQQLQEQPNTQTQTKESPRAILAEETGIDKDNDNTNLRMASLFQISFNPTYINDSLIDD